jgi:hypothetical protein
MYERLNLRRAPAKSTFRLTLEVLESRTVPAKLVLSGSQAWTIGAADVLAHADSQPPQQGTSVFLSYEAASWDDGWWGDPNHQHSGSVSVDQGSIQLITQPSPGESLGDEIEVTLDASASAYWVNQYHQSPVIGDHSAQASVAGPNGKSLDFQTVPSFQGKPSAQGTQTFVTTIGQTIPLSFRLFVDRENGTIDNLDGQLSITATIENLQKVLPTSLQWGSSAQGGVDYSYQVNVTPDKNVPVALYWAPYNYSFSTSFAKVKDFSYSIPAGTAARPSRHSPRTNPQCSGARSQRPIPRNCATF